MRRRSGEYSSPGALQDRYRRSTRTLGPLVTTDPDSEFVPSEHDRSPPRTGEARQRLTTGLACRFDPAPSTRVCWTRRLPAIQAPRLVDSRPLAARAGVNRRAPRRRTVAPLPSAWPAPSVETRHIRARASEANGSRRGARVRASLSTGHAAKSHPYTPHGKGSCTPHTRSVDTSELRRAQLPSDAPSHESQDDGQKESARTPSERSSLVEPRSLPWLVRSTRSFERHTSFN